MIESDGLAVLPESLSLVLIAYPRRILFEPVCFMTVQFNIVNQ